MPRVLVLADIGHHNYHVGDEAMAISVATELTSRGFEVYLATKDPEHSRHFIGGVAGYVKTLPIPRPPAERELYLDQLRQHLDGQPAHPDIETFVRDLSSMDGIVIAGGGTMNSTYGWLLHERAAYGLVARAQNIPLVISSQSLGPVLTEADSEVLKDLLSTAQLVGVRELASQAWTREQGITAHHIIDDATFYVHARRSLPGRPIVDLPDRYICATFTDLSPTQAKKVGQLLDDMHRSHGLRTVFLPHRGEPGKENGDVETHAQIASHMFTNPVQLPIVHTDDAVQVHRAAFIGFSNRYHPGVFALSAGVPFLALLSNAFSDMRLRGMMEQYGAENYAIPTALISSDAPFEALNEIIALRSELSDTLLRRTEELRGFSAAWWDAVTRVLLYGERAGEPELTEMSETSTIFTGDWNITNLLVRDDIAAISLEAAQTGADTDRAISWDYQHLLQRDRAEAKVDELERKNAELEDSLVEAEENATFRGWVRRKMRGE